MSSIMSMFMTLIGSGYLAGLDALESKVVQEYIGPLVILIVVIGVVVCFIKKQTRELFVILALGAIVVAVIYLAPWAFGPNGPLTNRSKELGQTAIN